MKVWTIESPQPICNGLEPIQTKTRQTHGSFPSYKFYQNSYSWKRAMNALTPGNFFLPVSTTNIRIISELAKWSPFMFNGNTKEVCDLDSRRPPIVLLWLRNRWYHITLISCPLCLIQKECSKEEYIIPFSQLLHMLLSSPGPSLPCQRLNQQVSSYPLPLGGLLSLSIWVFQLHIPKTLVFPLSA